jgi:hypothetical protein
MNQEKVASYMERDYRKREHFKDSSSTFNMMNSRFAAKVRAN